MPRGSSRRYRIVYPLFSQFSRATKGVGSHGCARSTHGAAAVLKSRSARIHVSSDGTHLESTRVGTRDLPQAGERTGFVLAVALRKVERARASGDNDLLCSFVGPRVRGQNLPSAISDTSKARGRSPRTVASATIQDRS